MTFARKITLSYAIIILFSVVITIVATVRMSNLSTFVLNVTSRVVPALLEEKRAERLFRQLSNLERKYRIFPEEEFKEFYFNKWETLNEQLTILEGKLSSDAEIKFLDDIKAELTVYNGLFQHSIRSPGVGLKNTYSKISKSEERFITLVALLFGETEKLLGEKLEKSTRMRKNTLRFMWAFLSIAVVSMIIMAVVFAQYFAYSLRRLQRGARKIAEGNFDYELSVRSDDEIGALTADFNAMARKLSDMESTKAQFMAMVLHDLKGPITALKGCVTMLLEDKTEVPPKRISSLELLNHEIEHLNRMVDDLNEISHIDSGVYKIIRAPFSLQELIGELASSMQPVLGELKQKLELVIDSNIPKINGDRDRIKQIFTNLISNASRFSPAGGTIHVSADAKVDRVFIQVRDSGKGIPKEKAEHIFDKFQTGDPHVPRRVGTGLGLYIVKMIIGSHGGRIWYQSEEGKGTTFFLSLPYV